MNPAMVYSKNGLHLTEGFEQCRLLAYPDVGGVWTIAFGHTAGVYRGMTCTKLQAIQWLLDDLRNSESFVNRVVTVVLTQDEFDALVDFVFNVGSGRFLNSTLLRLLNLGNYLGAANEFDKWDHVAGKVVGGLLRRRKIETAEFERGWLLP